MKLPVIALAAIGAALLSSPAQAQLSVVQDQLERFATAASERGFRQQDEFATGSLDDQGAEEFELTLDGGKRYTIVAFCDGDCSDLDLTLATSDGDEVDSDLADDDYPVVEVQTRQDGTYTLRVVMAACSVEPCFYGVGVFTREQ
jgi:hypothetical protein